MRYTDHVLRRCTSLLRRSRHEVYEDIRNNARPRTQAHRNWPWPQKSLKDARDEARRLLIEVSQPETTTFAAAFETYLNTYIKPNYKPRSALEVERLIRKHAPALFPKTLPAITTGDCTKIFDGLLNTPGEANHFFGVLRTFFSWAENVVTSPFASAQPLQACENSEPRTCPFAQ